MTGWKKGQMEKEEFRRTMTAMEMDHPPVKDGNQRSERAPRNGVTHWDSDTLPESKKTNQAD